MEASREKKQEYEPLTLEEFWQIHFCVPTHKRTGEELTNRELLGVIALREVGCRDDADHIKYVDGIGYRCEICSRGVLDMDCKT